MGTTSRLTMVTVLGLGSSVGCQGADDSDTSAPTVSVVGPTMTASRGTSSLSIDYSTGEATVTAKSADRTDFAMVVARTFEPTDDGGRGSWRVQRTGPDEEPAIVSDGEGAMQLADFTLTSDRSGMLAVRNRAGGVLLYKSDPPPSFLVAAPVSADNLDLDDASLRRRAAALEVNQFPVPAEAFGSYQPAGSCGDSAAPCVTVGSLATLDRDGRIQLSESKIEDAAGRGDTTSPEDVRPAASLISDSPSKELLNPSSELIARADTGRAARCKKAKAKAGTLDKYAASRVAKLMGPYKEMFPKIALIKSKEIGIDVLADFVKRDPLLMRTRAGVVLQEVYECAGFAADCKATYEDTKTVLCSGLNVASPKVVETNSQRFAIVLTISANDFLKVGTAALRKIKFSQEWMKMPAVKRLLSSTTAKAVGTQIDRIRSLAEFNLAITVDPFGQVYFSTSSSAGVSNGVLPISVAALVMPPRDGRGTTGGYTSADWRSFLSGESWSACVNAGALVQGTFCVVHSGALSSLELNANLGFSAGVGLGAGAGIQASWGDTCIEYSPDVAKTCK